MLTLPSTRELTDSRGKVILRVYDVLMWRNAILLAIRSLDRKGRLLPSGKRRKTRIGLSNLGMLCKVMPCFVPSLEYQYITSSMVYEEIRWMSVCCVWEQSISKGKVMKSLQGRWGVDSKYSRVASTCMPGTYCNSCPACVCVCVWFLFIFRKIK